MVDRPVGSSGLGRVELVDGRTVQVVGPDAEVALELVQAAVDVDPRDSAGRRSSTPGSGAPQNRFRLMDQSRAPSSHLPKAPSRTWAGIQSISWLSSSMRSLTAVTFTNQELTAL